MSSDGEDKEASFDEEDDGSEEEEEEEEEAPRKSRYLILSMSAF